MNIKTYLAHRKAYTGNSIWFLTVWQRQPTFRQVAIETAHTLAKGWVLDIGTGPAYLPQEIIKRCKNVNVVGLDISPVMLFEANKRLTSTGLDNRIFLVNSSAENLPFADNTFDSVQSMFSFHLWSNQKQGIQEIYRVLKPDNQAAILVGAIYSLHGIWKYMPVVPKGIYSDLKNMCLNAGFREVKVTRFHGGRDFIQICMIK